MMETKDIGTLTRMLRVFLLASVVSACGSKNSDDGDTGTDPGDAGDASVDGGGYTEVDTLAAVCAQTNPALAELNAQALFDYPHVPTFDIYLPPAAWEDLRANAVDEEYTPADACFEGQGIGEVGLRFKGSVGSLAMCYDDNGVNTCRKLSLKLKFDKYDETKRFYGLKRLNLQGNRYDDTYMKEKLAYELFRSMGIQAPRALWANVRVNGEDMGLYGMVEQVDGRFTADRWPENGDGNLYKEAWPIRADVAWLINERLRTNRDQNPDVSAFIAFTDAMLAAEEDALRPTLAGFMDIDYFARYMVVDDAIANYDGVTAMYSTEDGLWYSNHNYYLYEEGPNRFTLIPWDLESTFMMGTFGHLPRWTEVPEDCNQTYSAWGEDDLPVIAPGCDPLMKALASDMTPYQQAGRQFLDTYFTDAALGARIDAYAAFIRPSVEADPHGPGITYFEQGLDNIMGEMPRLRMRMEAIIAGETWTPVQIFPDRVTDFEDQNDLGLALGITQYVNPPTTTSLSVNTETAMVGAKDLVVGFNFANGGEAWDQWANFVINLEGGTFDVTGMIGIRLWVRSDQPRELRLELDSPYASSANGWLREGWFIDLTEEATQVEVFFQDADIPYWGYDQGQEPMTDLANVLAKVRALYFAPQCVGRGNAGFLPEGTTDDGFVEIDNIELF